MRPDRRKDDELRKVHIVTGFIKNAEGSVLIEMGNTRVICTATIEDKVPPFLKDQKKGWLTAEYSMLPRATPTRTVRESTQGRIGGRTHEIQRLIGRALRSIIDLESIGERTIWIDCDVIEADGGTRTASITGAYISLMYAIRHLIKNGTIAKNPVKDYLAAVSVGIVNNTPLLDLVYEEDSKAEVDMNVVMTGSGEFVEIQGTAEGKPFNRDTMDKLIRLAESGIKKLISIQKEILEKESTYSF